MADKEEGEKNTSREGEETVSRGNEWEVVTLTESTYAAAPNPKEDEGKDDGKDLLHNQDADSGLHMEEGDRLGGKKEESRKDFDEYEEFPGKQFLDKKSDRLPISDTGYEENATFQELNVGDKEQSIYSTDAFSSLHSETGFGSSTAYGENVSVPEMNEPSEWDLDKGAPDSPQPAKDGKYEGSDVPGEAWWKRSAASLYAHAKEANAVWSIFIAATVMGLVILGQRWQQEKWQVLQLKWQANINNEKTGRMLGPLNRLKEVIVGGHRRGSFIRGSASVEN